MLLFLLSMNKFRAPLDFLREVRVELTKVVWPTRQQTIQLTIIVVMVTILVGFFIGILDYGLGTLVQYLISQ